MIDQYYLLFKLFFSQVEPDGLIPAKMQKRIRHLQGLADPIYTGDVPLSEIDEV